MSALALLVFAIGAIGASPAAIYRCPGSDGEVLFSDRPCADGHLQAMQPVITLDMAHFSADEQATLERLKETGQPGREPHRRPVSNRTNVKSDDDRRCEAAHDGSIECTRRSVEVIARPAQRRSMRASANTRSNATGSVVDESVNESVLVRSLVATSLPGENSDNPTQRNPSGTLTSAAGSARIDITCGASARAFTARTRAQ